MEINFSCDNYFFTQTTQTYTDLAHALLVHPIRMGGNAVNRKFGEFREFCVRKNYYAAHGVRADIKWPLHHPDGREPQFPCIP